MTSPYVGPRPFEREETPSFKGRDRETGELVSLVVSSRLVVLYAPSGAGKTSLLNAGLIPALEQEGFDVLPVARIRPLVVDQAPVPEAGNVYAFGVLSSWVKVTPELTVGDHLAGQEHRLDADGFPDPRAVVIDQFEELFTAHPERWPEREPFLRQLVKALDDDPLLRIVLAIREDYLAQLEAYAGVLPEGFRYRYRLDRLGRAAALGAITEPLEPTARSFAPGVAEKLVDDLLTFRVDRGDRTSVKVPGEFVEPVHLQVVCQRLWEGLPPDVTEITQQHLRAFGDVDDVLAQLYDDAVRSAVSSSGVRESTVRRWIAEMLITAGGTRGTVYRAADSTGELPNDAVDALERCRLVRAEWRAGARWYELTHDRLIDPIQVSNARYFAAAAARRRRRLGAAALSLPLIAAAVVSLLWATRGSSSATKALQDQLALVQNLQRYRTQPGGALGGQADQAMHGVTWLGGNDRAVGVGFDRKGGLAREAIWELRGGRWTRAGPADRPGVLNAAASDGKTVVAVGTAGPAVRPGSSSQDAAVWTLVGRRWVRTCTAECGDGVRGGGHHGQTMRGVVARSGGGFVGVGYDRSDAEAHLDAAVWTSRDGIRWSRVANGRGTLGNGQDLDQVMNAVTETPSGLLVAVGRDRAAGAVWTSADGSRWRRIRSAALVQAGATLELYDVVSSGSVLVAVGRRGNPKGNLNEAAVWLSTDEGGSWRRVKSPVFEQRSGGASGGRGQQMRSVATVPFGFVAVGGDHPSGPAGPSTAAVWTSLDGEVWTPVSGPSFGGSGNYSMQSVASAGSDVVAVGDAPAPYDRRSQKQDAAVWSTIAGG